MIFVGDLPFKVPARPVVTMHPPATPQPEFTPIDDTPVAPPAAVVPTTISLESATFDELTQSVIVVAEFAGAAGETVDAAAGLSDGCQTVRSALQQASSGDVLRFSIDPRSLNNGPVQTSVRIGSNSYPGESGTKTASSQPQPSAFPPLDIVNIAWESFTP